MHLKTRGLNTAGSGTGPEDAWLEDADLQADSAIQDAGILADAASLADATSGSNVFMADSGRGDAQATDALSVDHPLLDSAQSDSAGEDAGSVRAEQIVELFMSALGGRRMVSARKETIVASLRLDSPDAAARVRSLRLRLDAVDAALLRHHQLRARLFVDRDGDAVPDPDSQVLGSSLLNPAENLFDFSGLDIPIGQGVELHLLVGLMAMDAAPVAAADCSSAYSGAQGGGFYVLLLLLGLLALRRRRVRVQQALVSLCDAVYLFVFTGIIVILMIFSACSRSGY